jgi:hypothetical protein
MSQQAMWKAALLAASDTRPSRTQEPTGYREPFRSRSKIIRR